MKNYKRNTIISIVLVIGLGSSFQAFVFRHKQKEIKMLESKYNTHEITLNRAKQSMHNYKKLSAEIDSTASVWQELREWLPEKQEMSELLREIAKAGELSKVDFILSKPLPPITQELYVESPLEIKVRCGYHELARFLSRLANLGRLINVRNLEILSYNSEESSHTVEVSFIASAYAVSKGQND